MDQTLDTERERQQVDLWTALASMKKTIFSWPDWLAQNAPSNPDSSLRSHETDQFVLTSLLADDSGAAIEGLQLRVVVWKYRPQEDATALLLVEDEGWTVISRIDCWPNAPHPNKHWKRLKEPAEIPGTHAHCCEDNAKLGRKAFKPYENLPSARAVDSEPQSFRDMMRLVEVYFNIDGAATLPPPDWQGSLF
ncbi:MAG: hypothetical protein E5V48_02565 [Mesorhizobium sp.]|nr:MAG: hypothetical protein E5V48_02565 [Mesorhizobium sp.]